MGESIHSKLSRVRKPHVHITYEVETNGAMVKKELPFVMGVMGDFSGNPLEPREPLYERKFIGIDRDNFDDVMKRMAPELNLRVKNTIQDDGSEMAIQLKFEKMGDFEPAALVNQVEPLKKILETRNKLRDLLSCVDRSQQLENVLAGILENTEKIQALKGELPNESSEPKKEGDQ